MQLWDIVVSCCDIRPCWHN